MANSISWQEFEAIVERLQKTFNEGGAKVTTGERLLGRISGVPRQIDISIRGNIGSEDVVIIVECKKWNRKVTVKDVEASTGVKKDVGAHIGIMVSTAGFSKTAYSVARDANINLYRYSDTQKDDWPNGLETSALLEIWELTPTTAYFVLAGGAQEPIATDEDLNFFLAAGQVAPPPSCLATIVKEIWESRGAADKIEGSWLSEFSCTTPDRPEIQKLGVGAISKFIRGIRRGRLHFEGLVDESAGQAKVQGWKMVFDGTFRPVPSGGSLPFTNTLSILMRSVFVRRKARLSSSSCTAASWNSRLWERTC